MADAYDAYRAGRLEEFYEPLVVDDEELARGLEDGARASTRGFATAPRPGFGPSPSSAVRDETVPIVTRVTRRRCTTAPSAG